MRVGCYEKLDIDGFVKPGTRVSGEDVLIGKVVKMRGSDNIDFGRKTHKDASTSMRRTETGRVDSVMITNNAEGSKMVKV